MKTKTIILIGITLFVAYLLTGCQKETYNPTPPKPSCEINNTGYIAFENSTSQTITLTLDGTNYTISSGEKAGKDVSAGLHSYSAITADGQWGWNGQVDVIQCGTKTVNLVI